MNLIATSKFGDCVRCGEKETSCKKRGKDLICTSCCKIEDTKKQVEKANLRNRVRGLYGHQVSEGKEDMASRANLMADLDVLASRIVRLREADENGNLVCFCCDKRIHWSMADCSHFISRKNLALRWDLKYNLRPSCKKCNQQEYGNLEPFADKLELECAGIVEILREKSREVYKPELQELKAMLIDFRAKLRLLEAKPTPHS